MQFGNGRNAVYTRKTYGLLRKDIPSGCKGYSCAVQTKICVHSFLFASRSLRCFPCAAFGVLRFTAVFAGRSCLCSRFSYSCDSPDSCYSCSLSRSLRVRFAVTVVFVTFVL